MTFSHSSCLPCPLVAYRMSLVFHLLIFFVPGGKFRLLTVSNLVCHGKLLVAHSKLPVPHGKLPVPHGKLPVPPGKPLVAHGKPLVAHGKLQEEKLQILVRFRDFFGKTLVRLW